jgi:hypothetical protein
MIKSRRMRLAGDVAQRRRRGMHIGCWWESEERWDGGVGGVDRIGTSGDLL